MKDILVPTVHWPCVCTPDVQESKKLQVIIINKDERKLLARNNGNENPIWIWNESYACEVQVSYLSSFVDLCFFWIFFIYGICWLYIFLTWSMYHFSVVTILGRYLFTSFTVSLGHYWKYHFWIALTHVDLTGMNYATWSYLTKSVWCSCTMRYWYYVTYNCPYVDYCFLRLLSIIK